ncbi:2-amino-4-hydroxy-6-hydroxymethyldihydropteridine diphosphokinase [Aestuariibacter salexigens]|uniref:2-amino-4-hydroxy-6- hydroxymethyldihydropteridine diphosphokinase n=1 Tax=Aestuariibacter salexigens TaxID=226010 RepID=UPI0003FE568C|nr:2-amino-4-hydroxy-6-hydroxymethyldihydropteridine diphosphokinase [Aestuariibacter salexigens]
MHSNIFLGIGANLGDPIQQVIASLRLLFNYPAVELIDVSSLYHSAPMGPQLQPDYVNAVAQIHCTLNAHDLLDVLQDIEQQSGRVRNGERWGPRTLDLDMLLFDNHTYNTQRLTVPHYGMRERAFVLYPLAEIAPQLVMPDGTPISSLLEQCHDSDLRIGLTRENVWQQIRS